MTYSYKLSTNQLDKVVDVATDADTSVYDKYKDIKQGQQNGNYTYDAIGNLTSDVSEGFTNITWNVYGKIQSITKTNGTTITYSYDVAGNRISKTVNGAETWYVRDASGNTMSIYTKEATTNNNQLTQTEVHLYGSSRLGIYNRKINVQTVVINTTGTINFERANRVFELSNHLGNVLVTISDKKIAVDSDGNGTVDYYTADVITANDYYPFGMNMPGRTFAAQTPYRYGFNGKEQDKETTGTSTYDYGFRIYSPALGKFLSVDPKASQFPHQSQYTAMDNDPINKTDPDGQAAVSTTGGDDPAVKVRASIGLRIGIGSSGANFNLTGSVGVQAGSSNTNLTTFVSGSVYGGSQLGTTPSGNGVQFDLSAGAYGSVGSGTGAAHNFNTLNYNTPSPFKNTSDVSVSWGQMVTYNSAINAQGDGPGAQTQGILNLRLGNNFSLSYNNDATGLPTFAEVLRKPLKITGTDVGWTGGLAVNVAGVEAGYKNFSGYRLESYPGGGVGATYKQTDYQKSFNKASTFIQVGSARVEYFGAAWLQNLIHNYKSHEATYDYNYRNKVNVSGGITR